ncbi:MAG TPA: hypothetical protein VKE41_18535, partial [Roseiflexaceae bacterium]|nr:hypothetical protein [Roseiflexaceae bacterium]
FASGASTSCIPIQARRPTRPNHSLQNLCPGLMTKSIAYGHPSSSSGTTVLQFLIVAGSLRSESANNQQQRIEKYLAAAG